MSTLKNYADPHLRKKMAKQFGFDFAFFSKSELRAAYINSKQSGSSVQPRKVEIANTKGDLINPTSRDISAAKAVQIDDNTASGRVVKSDKRTNNPVKRDDSKSHCESSVNKVIEHQTAQWRKSRTERFSPNDKSAWIKGYIRAFYQVVVPHVTYSESFRWEIVLDSRTFIIIRYDVFDIIDKNGNHSTFLIVERNQKYSEKYHQKALGMVHNEYPNGIFYLQW